jgi:transcriptional regulator with XRE-family HTH domain
MPAADGIRAYVSQRIKEIRSGFGETGISQEALAEKLGVTPNTISRWETGTYEPTLDNLEALSRELGVSILDFFPRAETKDEKSKNVDALLRTAQKLDAADLIELRRYAEYRRARSMYSPRSPGRKRK